PQDTERPHSPGMTMAGASMLWVGWYGFNAGSALAANGNAGMAMVVTHVAAATAALTWMAVQWLDDRRPRLIGLVSGSIAGLAAITPASGFVGPIGALAIGLSAGAVCYFAARIVKRTIDLDDSLDVFAVHGVGGTIGVVLVSFFAAGALGGLGLQVTVWHQLTVQILGAVATIIWAGGLSYAIVKVTAALVGLKVSTEAEAEGLDLAVHGEHGYSI
ncbi:MAG: ammonium transporter, partial [Proteobacteria bacterium]|nr:ammonium transporter [Pseudomonadota bacterium]